MRRKTRAVTSGRLKTKKATGVSNIEDALFCLHGGYTATSCQ